MEPCYLDPEVPDDVRDMASWSSDKVRWVTELDGILPWMASLIRKEQNLKRVATESTISNSKILAKRTQSRGNYSRTHRLRQDSPSAR